MSLSSEVRFEFMEVKPIRSPGPLERLWQSPSFGTSFLSSEEVRRREHLARLHGAQEVELHLNAECDRKLQQLQREVSEALAAFERERHQYFQHVEKEVVKLALAIAYKVIGHELKVNPASLSGVVQDTLMRLQTDGEVTLRVSPAESQAWRTALDARSRHSGFTIVEDETLPIGRCLLETSVGSTTLDPISELAEVEQALVQRGIPGGEPTESPLVQ